MSVLTVENVSHGYGARQLLSNASFRLLKGEHVALVGANGEGKSTFLNIINGSLAPDTGKIEWAKRAKVGYLDQHSSLKVGTTIRENLRLAFNELFELEKEMLSLYDKMGDVDGAKLDSLLEDASDIQSILDHHGFYTIDATIDQIASGFGLTDLGMETAVDQLSGGQRSKVLLAKLLLQQPTILILDEPTNYLDVQHIAWLTNYLQNYENAFLLVSHDIPFINDVCNIVYHLTNGELNRYVGNYDNYLLMKQQKEDQLQQAIERQQREIADIEDFVARNKARVATRGMANSRAKRLDKMDILEKPKERLKSYFDFKVAKDNPSRIVIEATNLVLGYESALTTPQSFTIERGQKIAIRGVNGIGKSTLLKTLLGLIEPFSGTVQRGEKVQVGYFEQEDNKQNSRTALDELWAAFPRLGNHEVRGELAKVGLTTDNIMSPMKVLSGGENAKVRLCKVMLDGHNVLVLDEPTNHLDPDAKDELQRALIAFPGTIILVSHEPYFYESWITHEWNIEGWTTKII